MNSYKISYYFPDIQQSESVFGSEPGDFQEFPFIVAILNKTDNKFLCSGALITEDTVLTTAPCVTHDTEILISIKREQENDTNESQDQIFDVVNVIRENQLNSQLYSDLAILKVETNFFYIKIKSFQGKIDT